MKNKIKYIATFLIGGLISFSACTDKFEDYNTDKTGFPEDKQEYDFNKYGVNTQIIQKGIYFNYNWGSGVNWPFQIMQNLGADMYSGYFHDCAKGLFAANSAYNLNEGWTSSNWVNTYGYIMPAIYRSEQLTEEEGYPSFLGITKILKVATMHRIADQYGPVVYSNFGSKTGSDPESLKDAYYSFFTDLEDGIKLVKDFVAANAGIESFYKFDILTKTRTYDEWLRFANSLRLRLAMRISNVDSAKAAAEVKKCFDSGIGFLEPETHMIAVSTVGSGYSNPLGEINKGWGEVYINASMESFLVGYNDPRLPKYFDPAVGAGDGVYLFPIAGTYKGIRQGINVAHGNYNNHSKSTVSQSTNAILMTPAEVCFLRAEAALRGYSTDNAKEYYEKGVEASLSQWGVAGLLNDYLNSERIPSDFKDAFESRFDVDAMTDITPKWDEADSNERKLERIITQKWIACYPEGAEAWAEQRRTGYPKLFKVYENNSKGTIDTDIMIRRLPFPATLQSDNPDQYNKLLQLLGGANDGGTRIWWDVPQNNF
ncbi:SusD/RagB family nutrient-binding outer membrane lipoprotein [Bacteroides sp. 51]|uniref:SusD/RagB family nutrient-binding outer membrane lipoprotein n=1 Tax=Bacteroides sp. 51 TaxID=2302938 RepID=UPI0013D247DC|nr:SusD/RagB family nutrient-binding outer membrane lipoprotein [Bacteroides sp. 51]NDV82212.1 SusD/RagB family nutrient-binding outer membrane lipoprotein [Bacteroides sp. 51]